MSQMNRITRLVPDSITMPIYSNRSVQWTLPTTYSNSHPTPLSIPSTILVFSPSFSSCSLNFDLPIPSTFSHSHITPNSPPAFVRSDASSILSEIGEGRTIFPTPTNLSRFSFDLTLRRNWQRRVWGGTARGVAERVFVEGVGTGRMEF